MEKLDLKKELKKYYTAGPKPVLINIPTMNYLMIDGQGDPNTSTQYASAVQAVYSIAYTLKFLVKKKLQVDYPVMPLEGLWWTPDMALFSAENKAAWLWTMMICTPELIDQNLLSAGKAEALLKRGLPLAPLVRLEKYTEGPSAQLMHIGPYSAEAENIRRLHDFIHTAGHTFDGQQQKHHEIYLSDPRKSAPEKMKTIIRQPVKP